MRRKLRQAGRINVAESARPSRGETRIERIDIFDACCLPRAVDESQIVSLTSVTQFLDRWIAVGFAVLQAAAQRGFAPAQHLQEGTTRPQSHTFRITTADMFFFAERVFGILVPKNARASYIG